jgi:hypothetical protein
MADIKPQIEMSISHIVYWTSQSSVSAVYFTVSSRSWRSRYDRHHSEGRGWTSSAIKTKEAVELIRDYCKSIDICVKASFIKDTKRTVSIETKAWRC